MRLPIHEHRVRHPPSWLIGMRGARMMIMQKARQLLTQTLVLLGAMARDDRMLEQFLLDGFRQLRPDMHDGGAERFLESLFAVARIGERHMFVLQPASDREAARLDASFAQSIIGAGRSPWPMYRRARAVAGAALGAFYHGMTPTQATECNPHAISPSSHSRRGNGKAIK
jgi:hypothetical protein